MNHTAAFPQAAAHALGRDLRAAVRGEVRFDAGSRALYATDSSNYRQVPIGVVLPLDAEDAATAVAIARKHQAPVLPRGAGTSLAGQCCNTAVVLDMSKYMNRILELDPARRTARVQPGVVLDDLRDAARPHRLTFGPDPSTHSRCTLGGMIGNNSCGVHSIIGRRTAENVEALEVLTYDGIRLRVAATSEEEFARQLASGTRAGQIYAGLHALRNHYERAIRERIPRIPRRVSGYDLLQLLPERGFHVARSLVGSEGTCVTILEATLKLIHDPLHHALTVIGYQDVFAAADRVPAVLESGCIGLEGIDDYLVRNMRRRAMLGTERALLPAGDGWLIVEFGGETPQQAKSLAERLLRRVHDGAALDAKVFTDAASQSAIWRLREAGLGATAREEGENVTWEGWEDAAVDPSRLGAYLRDFRDLLQRHGYRGALYGHFGDGCVHTRIDFDLKSKSGIDKWRRFLDAAADLVVRYGGSLSGEHGDGQSRAALLPKMFGAELVAAFNEFKRLWDPAWKMNPGKVVDPFLPTENLRLGTDYRPPDWPTRFAFRGDDGSFANAALRCVGVGACRKHDSGTMCPSYMATREERYSTRGRARLLFEMLHGDPLWKGWHSPHVAEALDLCLSCKACKHECPVQVDMASYKAEFLFHRYRRRLRPLDHYLLGYLGAWAPLAARMPRLANRMIRSPPLAALGKRIAGLAPERSAPDFAPQTFRRWFATRAQPDGNGSPVVLWPDTFNDHFHPEILRAAVRVLEALGHRVLVPLSRLCCGRPFYDFGMLDPARRYLQAVLEALQPWIRDGLPIVGLEPSCMAVFRDELLNLFPHDEDARRLAAQCTLFDEFIQERADRLSVATTEGRALVQTHCHQNALFRADATGDVLARLGFDVNRLDAGCCGLAGAFGFRHFEVSRQIGERALFPAVRAAPQATVIADGFSCREQIRQFTGRRALHLAQVVEGAIDRGAARRE